MGKPFLKCSGPEWDRIRIKIMARDDCTCQFEKLGLAPLETCTADEPENRPRHLHVHHIIQRLHGGTHDEDNLITLCVLHHMEIHPHMKFERGREVGWEYEGESFGWEY